MKNPLKKDEKQAPSVRGLMQPGQIQDKKYQSVKDILTIDENLGSKTTIDNALVQTYLDILPRWDTATSMEDLWSPTKEGTSNRFGDRYRVNAMASGGKQIDRYVDALKNYLPEVPGLYNRDNAQLKEGNKK